MRKILLLAVLFMLGCAMQEEVSSVNHVQELLLTDEELDFLGMMRNESACSTEEHETGEYSPLAQSGICFYSLNNTEVIIQLSKFTNKADLNGSYQYESSHLFGSSGIISQDTYGDQSKFHVNSEDDYGAEFNEPGIYYYHLWITKDLYLIHVTSGGADIEDTIAEIGEIIMSRFE